MSINAAEFYKWLKVFNVASGTPSPLQYFGTWNANTNTPTLVSSVGVAGGFYVVNVAGSTNLNGISSWAVGDWAIFDGTVWQKIPAINFPINYLGNWNASTNTPALVSSVGTENTIYTVSVAGSTNLNGISSWAVGDLVLFNGSVWKKIPVTNFPLNYLGTWNANTNSPPLVSSTGVQNSLYQVSVAGSTNLNGISAWSVGDGVLFNGTIWQRIPTNNFPLNFIGVWNASTNSPPLTSSVGIENSLYQVSVAGSTNLNGITNWTVGDGVLFNGTTWQRIPSTNFPLNYLGTWNADTNTPTLISSVGIENSLYQVSVAGSTNLNGISSWAVGDLALFNGTTWQKVPSTSSVTILTDAGSVTGNSFALQSGYPGGCGATIKFSASGTTIVFEVTDNKGNTTIGANAGNTGMGFFNTSIGENSASNYGEGESSNNNFANLGTIGDSHVQNLGTHGSGDGEVSVCKLAGVNGNTITAPLLVVIDPTTNKLGTTPIPSGSTPWSPDFRSGFELTWNDDGTPSTLLISAGKCIDSTNTFAISGNSAILSVTGIDTGTFENGKIYYQFVIADSNNILPTLYRFSLSYNAPVLPSGYSIFRVVNTVLSNISGTPDFIPFDKEGHFNDIYTVYQSTDASLMVLDNISNEIGDPAIIDYSNVISLFAKGVLNEKTHTVNIAGSKLNICSSLETTRILSDNSLLSAVSDIRGIPLFNVDANKRARCYLDSNLDTLTLKLIGVKESFYSPAPPFTPILLPNLTLWLDGNDPANTGVKPTTGTGISAWVDKSMASNNGEQASGSNQPTFEDAIFGSLGAILGNGSSMFMTIPFNANLNSAEFTLAVVCKGMSAFGDFQCPFSSRDISSGNSTGYNFYLKPDDNWTAWYGNNTPGYQNIDDGPVNSSKFTLLVIRCIAGVVTFYINGVSIGTGSGFTPNPGVDSYLLASETATFKWPSYVGEIVYCNAALSDDNLALLTMYEIARWGTV